jgi:hypothetical protein
MSETSCIYSAMNVYLSTSYYVQKVQRISLGLTSHIDILYLRCSLPT